MIAYIILGIIVFFCVLVLLRWFVEAEPKEVFKVLKWLGVILALLLIVWLALSGRLALAFAALPTLLVWFGRFRTVFNVARFFKRFYNPATGAQSSSAQKSQVETSVVRMELDLETGELDGEVLEGPHLGRMLRELTLEQALDVLAYAKSHDEEAVKVLLSYLERQHGYREDDTEDGKYHSDGFKSSMGRGEALDILGLEEGASKAEIKAAYHRLIAMVHPDKGGSDYLAAKINQAKDLLLNG